jgi:hypothetical protein
LLTDNDFADRVAEALDREVLGIRAETAADWRDMQHRHLAERIKALAAASRLPSPVSASGVREPVIGVPGVREPVVGVVSLLRPVATLVGLLRDRQSPSGLFRGGDSVDSPPDTALSVNDLADAALLLRDVGDPAARPLTDEVGRLLGAATPALLRGGVHTASHRWELSAALARLHRLAPRPAFAERAGQWLAEGVDIEEGLYSERSPDCAAHVSNPSLLVIAEVFDRPDLLDAVDASLTATLDLLLPDGTVETVLSRRRDQRSRIPLRAFLLPLRVMAVLRGRGDLAWAAHIALEQGLQSPGTAAAELLLRPVVGRALPPPAPPVRPRLRHFRSAATVIAHGPAPGVSAPDPPGSLDGVVGPGRSGGLPGVVTPGRTAGPEAVPGSPMSPARAGVTAVVFGGSDYSRHRRIRSGLANSPTFLRVHAGAAVLDSVRLSRRFFGAGPFRAEGLILAPGPVAIMNESVTAAHYHPLGPADRDDAGSYRLGDDGRSSAAMSFGRRARDEVTLTTAVRVTLGPAAHQDPAVSHRGLGSAEAAVDAGHRGPAVPDLGLGGAGTVVSDGREGPRDRAGCTELTVEMAGPAVDWTLELAFRPGGAMTGARALGDGRWLLESGTAVYRVGGDELRVTVAEAPATAAESGPTYHPGADYEFLGGTDAAEGELLYVTGKAPSRLRLRIDAEMDEGDHRQRATRANYE